MDYSKFYLKNYVPEDEPDKDVPEGSVPRIEERIQPEIIYINPDGEVFDPEETKRDERDDYKTTDSEYSAPEIATTRKPETIKKSFANRFCQAVLLFAIVVMSIVVSADFVTDGKAVAALTDLLSAQKTEYYAVLADGDADLETSKVNAYAMRLKGGAGFTIKNGDNYYNVYSVFEKKSDAENYAEQNGGKILTLSTDYYDDMSGELKNYADYPVRTCADLNAVIDGLTNKELTTAQAIEKLNDVKEDFASTYDNMNNAAQGDDGNKSVPLLANASVALAALERLCDTSVSRPNLVCDIRYTVCSIIFTYCYSK